MYTWVYGTAISNTILTASRDVVVSLEQTIYYRDDAFAQRQDFSSTVYASTPCALDGFDLGGRSPLPLAASVPIKPRATQCISLIIGDRRIRLKGRRVFPVWKRRRARSSRCSIHDDEQEEERFPTTAVERVYLVQLLN